MTLVERLAQSFIDEHPTEAARVLERMAVDRRAAVIHASPAGAAAALAEMMPGAVAESLARLDASDAALALDHLPIDRAVAVLRGLDAERVNAVLQAAPPEKQDLLGRVLAHPEGTAGALMDPSVPELPVEISVAEARVRLRRTTAGSLQYVFVTDRTRALTGVLEISDLLRARPGSPIRSVLREGVPTVPAWMPAAAVRTHHGWDLMPVLPVVDESGRLLGGLRYETLRRLQREGGQGRDAENASTTVSALGELFHLGLAGLVEGVAASASPRARGDQEKDGAP
jgi:magnesium transporter